jgi:asparagine synthetase B (glutamine-hydrolysing)
MKLEMLIDLNIEDYEEANMEYLELTQVLFDEVFHSNVRNGLALSSGIDSNSIFHELLRRDLEANPLIVNFPNSPSFSEFEAAVTTCKKYKVPFIEILGNQEGSLLQGLQNLTIRNDGPHADPSGIAYLNIFKGAQENGIKVVQLGHGPDELFWGYEYLVKQNAEATLNASNQSLKHFWKNPADATRLLSKQIQRRGNPVRSFNSTDPYLDNPNQWIRTRAEIVHSYLSANGLRQSDRLAMSFSVEPRTVYADFRLYKWTQSNLLNENERSQDKRFFRENAYFGGEHEIRSRRKLGFSSDYGQWFNDPSIESELVESIAILRKAGILEPRLKFPPWNRTHEKYRILMLGLWLKEHAN